MPSITFGGIQSPAGSTLLIANGGATPTSYSLPTGQFGIVNASYLSLSIGDGNPLDMSLNGATLWGIVNGNSIAIGTYIQFNPFFLPPGQTLVLHPHARVAASQNFVAFVQIFNG